MLQFTLREMLWLTTIAALAIGWLIHSHSEQTESQYLQIQLMDQRLAEAKDLVQRLGAVPAQDFKAGNDVAAVRPSTQADMPQRALLERPAGVKRHVRIVHRPLNSEL